MIYIHWYHQVQLQCISSIHINKHNIPVYTQLNSNTIHSWTLLRLSTHFIQLFPSPLLTPFTIPGIFLSSNSIQVSFTPIKPRKHSLRTHAFNPAATRNPTLLGSPLAEYRSCRGLSPWSSLSRTSWACCLAWSDTRGLWRVLIIQLVHENICIFISSRLRTYALYPRTAFTRSSVEAETSLSSLELDMVYYFIPWLILIWIRVVRLTCA